MSFRRKRVVAWIATLAMALQALWPLLAQARPRVAGELVPICTVEGVTHYLELPAGKSPLDERSASHGEHCKLCVFGSDRGSAIDGPVVSVCFKSDPKNQEAIPSPVPSQEPSHFLAARPRAPPSQS